MSPEASAQGVHTEHDPYASVREQQENRGRLLPQETVRWFYGHLKKCVFRAALSRWKTPEEIVNDFRSKASDCINFEFKFDGEEILQNCDFIFANHQGPKEDGERRREDGEVRGIGGIECLIAIDTFPPHARIVLRRNLVSLNLKELLRAPRVAFPRFVKALAFRRKNPITVDRSAVKPLRARNPKAFDDYIRFMRDERARVGDECCDSVEKGHPVVIYPEGTRSEDGRILGFVSKYFESIVEKYLFPRLEGSDRPIKIGLLVADTLRTFPYGVGKNVKAYDHPITMKGVWYDPKNIVDALQRTVADKPRDENGRVILDQKEIKKLGRMMLIEVRAQMERTLVDIVHPQ